MFRHVDVPIEIAGLNQFISSVPLGTVLLVKGGFDPAKRYLVQYLGQAALKGGRPVTYVTSKSKEVLEMELQDKWGQNDNITVVDELSSFQLTDHIKFDSIVIIDSYSYLLAGKDLEEVRSISAKVYQQVRCLHSLAILVLDDGMLDERSESMLKHFSDALIVFTSMETAEGLRRFLRIPMWVNGAGFDDNIYFSYADSRLSIDLRYRVV